MIQKRANVRLDISSDGDVVIRGNRHYNAL